MSRTTLSPLPQWLTLSKSLFIGSIDGKDLAKPWLLRDSDVPYWFSRSAFAMLAIAKWWEAYTDKELPLIWIPDYFCEHSLQFLRYSNFPLYFYPISDGLTPDWKSCRYQAKTNRPDIFIIVNYFGYPTDGKQARQFCDEQECILVEDAAHVLVPLHDIGSYGEFIFYSPHKLFAIPDGAVLIQRSKTNVLRKLGNKKPVEVMKRIYRSMPQESPSYLIWLIKRISQKFLPDFLWLKQLKIENAAVKNNKPIRFKTLQSNFSRRLLKADIPNIDEYIIARQTNQILLKEYYRSTEEKALFQNGDYIPYMAGFLRKVNSHAEEHFRELKEKHYPVMKWPDLPPEVLADSDNHRLAHDLEKNLLFFPVHQSIGIHAIKRIGCSFGDNALRESGEKDYQLEWYKGGKEEWSDWMANAGKANLLQSWGYGEAKVKVEGWKAKRGLIKQRGKIIAIFQALEKSWGPVGVIRINRGPLFLDKNNSFDTKYNIYKILRNTWTWWKGRLLLIAPNLISTPENIGIQILLGYRKRKIKQWSSSYIDLSLSEIELRINLNGKWRNQLKRAEKNGLILKVGNSLNSLNWLLDHYEKMMKDKDFKGPTSKLYFVLSREKPDDILVFQVYHESKAVAGLLILRHGNACTYQIGWNSHDGRKVFANNFLLWKAVLEMKKKGCNVFDLGGIDEKNTPGIARFKRGLNGVEYTLVGEWVRI